MATRHIKRIPPADPLGKSSWMLETKTSDQDSDPAVRMLKWSEVGGVLLCCWQRKEFVRLQKETVRAYICTFYYLSKEEENTLYKVVLLLVVQAQQGKSTHQNNSRLEGRWKLQGSMVCSELLSTLCEVWIKGSNAMSNSSSVVGCTAHTLWKVCQQKLRKKIWWRTSTE